MKPTARTSTFGWAILAAAIALAPGCDNDQSGEAPGIGVIEVRIEGQVRSADTDLPIEGITARVIRELLDDEIETVAEVGTTDAEGRFAAPGPIRIQPEDFRYFLRLEDPLARYQPNAATVSSPWSAPI